jgi:glyoxylase-like metal-dependent hydrolase (beta-lactamase superfamily II)
MMDPLWGEFLPVPPEQLHATKNGETVEINGIHVRVIETPGHAYHHNVYLIDQVCFTGDICGVRLAGLPHLRLPTPPPEFHLETWRESLRRLRKEHIIQLALTHFGFYNDVEWHFRAIENALDEVNRWMEEIMPNQPALETLRQQIVDWERERAMADGLDAEAIQALETANPAWMAADGLARYWHKYRETSP